MAEAPQATASDLLDELDGIVLCSIPRCPKCKRFLKVGDVEYRVLYLGDEPAEIQSVIGLNVECKQHSAFLLKSHEFDFEWEGESEE